MDIPASLRQIYPDAPPCEIYGGGATPWIVRDDGHGPFISDWNYSKPQPSDDAIAAAWLVVQKKRAWEAIKAERDRLTQNSGYQLDGYWFHSDAYSLSQQQGLILAAMQVQESGGDMNAPLMATPWYAMGSVPVVMTASLALRLLPAAIAQQVAIFEAAKAHKAALEASADPANYGFSGGWPPIYNK